MSMAVDGLVSGLDTTALVRSLMQVEAQPQLLLTQKSTAAARLVSALQGLNTKVSSLAEAATKAADPRSWDLYEATSSSDSVTATASAGAQAATVELYVDQLATNQVSMLAGQSLDSLLGQPETVLTLELRGDSPEPELVTILLTPSDASKGLTLDDIVTAINTDDDAELSAARVKVGADGAGEPRYAVQLTGGSGTANAFDLWVGADTSGTPLVDRNAAQIGAQDAAITLWPGTVGPDGLPMTLTSATNTFTEVLPSVTMTVNRTTAADDPPVRVHATADHSAMSSLLADLVSNVGVVLSEITSRTAATTTTGDDGRTVVTGGLFSGDSTVRTLADQVRSAVSMPVGGLSSSAVGITLDRSGEITFDREAFDKAMAEDPAGTRAMAMTIAGRVADVAESSSDPTDGTLSLVVKSHEGLVSDLNRQIEDWDRRLELRRATLERTYAALEVTLSNLQAQSTWLAGQLATLPTSSSTNG